MGLRHFIRVLDLKKEEVEGLIDRAMEFKRTHNFRGLLSGKILALIFEKASTRTRVSFESAMLRMGGHTLFLSGRDLQLARGEPIKDTARVLSRYVDVVVLRTYSHSTITEFAVYSSVPVINGLSDRFHPCQALSDLMTVLERGKDPFKEKVVWIGDGNNVAQSWIEVSALLGFPLVICCPPG
ncbi:MAG: ornithine carbamoyltransferase, partial [Sulfolobales archaeon]